MNRKLMGVGCSLVGLLVGAGALVGCGADTNGRGGNPGGDKPDMVFVFADVDQAGASDDAMPGGGPNVCGDTDPTCIDFGKGPAKGAPFPLKNDPKAAADRRRAWLKGNGSDDVRDGSFSVTPKVSGDG